MEKYEIIEILEDNQDNIEKGNWEKVYETISESGCKRRDFSDFLIENGFDPSNLFKTYVPDYAFMGSHRLEYITLSNSIPEIGDSAFSWCTFLQSITLPNSLKIIKVRAFSGCSSLQSITLPNSLKEIGDKAFEGCEWLTEIKYDGTKEEWEEVKLGKEWIKWCPVNRKKNKITFLK